MRCVIGVELSDPRNRLKLFNDLASYGVRAIFDGAWVVAIANGKTPDLIEAIAQIMHGYELNDLLTREE